jgi:hypothetical protein
MTDFKMGCVWTLAVKRRKRAVHAESLPVYKLTRDVLINHHMAMRENNVRGAQHKYTVDSVTRNFQN